MSNLSGRTAIVTGGGQGIGRGIAMALARAGARVVIFGRTEGTLRAAHDDIAAFGGTAGLVSATSLRKVVANAWSKKRSTSSGRSTFWSTTRRSYRKASRC